MKIQPLQQFNGAYTVPGDKSITHRAIMLNAVAQGTATVRNALLGADCLSTIACMRALGAQIDIDGDTVVIRGAKKLKNRQTLDVGNSGTTLRLLTGLLSSRHVTATLTGDASICARPMARVIDPLRQMGALIKDTDGCAPVTVKPATLKGLKKFVMPVASAQVKSAILLAALNAEGETTVVSPVATRDHTERMLEAQSAEIVRKKDRVTVAKCALKSVDVDVPGDVSSAAFLIVLASCLERSHIVLKNIGVNPTRTALFDVINTSGGFVQKLNLRGSTEPVADLMIQTGKPKPFVLGGAMIANLIDEIPVLCVYAACAEGDSVIKDAKELKVKESNRIDSTVAMLKAMGVQAEPTDDGLIVHGTSVIMGGGTIDPKGDHRIAMAGAIACALSLDGGEVLNPECADISYPKFFELFEDASV